MPASERTSDQERAADALAKAQTVRDGDPDDFRRKYRSYVERLAAAIVMNGLGQALVTERAAAGGGASTDERAHRRLYDNLQGWLCRSEEGVYPGESDILSAITSNPEASYLVAQAEALAWLGWHKKFCQAYLPREAS